MEDLGKRSSFSNRMFLMLLVVFGPMVASRGSNFWISWKKSHPAPMCMTWKKLQAGEIPCGIKVSYTAVCLVIYF
jgi:hypothetical protein